MGPIDESKNKATGGGIINLSNLQMFEMMSNTGKDTKIMII